jgi:hypothetical protein
MAQRPAGREGVSIKWDEFSTFSRFRVEIVYSLLLHILTLPYLVTLSRHFCDIIAPSLGAVRAATAKENVAPAGGREIPMGRPGAAWGGSGSLV